MEKEILENIYFCDKQDEVPSFVMNELTKHSVPQNSILETGINYKDFVVERKNETSSYEISNLSHSDRQIKWIINCSAYTNVEKAEEDVEIIEKQHELNDIPECRPANNNSRLNSVIARKTRELLGKEKE